MSEDKDKTKSVDSTSENDKKEEKPIKKQGRLKFDEKDMYKITYDF